MTQKSVRNVKKTEQAELSRATVDINYLLFLSSFIFQFLLPLHLSFFPSFLLSSFPPFLLYSSYKQFKIHVMAGWTSQIIVPSLAYTAGLSSGTSVAKLTYK